MHFQAHFSRLFGIFDTNQKKWHGYFVEYTNHFRLSNTIVDSAFESWNHELWVFDDFEGYHINNAVTQRFEKCTYKRDFREFSAFLMKIIWAQIFLESDRLWRELRLLYTKLHIYNEPGSTNNSCGSPRWKYHTTSKFWVYYCVNMLWIKYTAHDIIQYVYPISYAPLGPVSFNYKFLEATVVSLVSVKVKKVG